MLLVYFYYFAPVEKRPEYTGRNTHSLSSRTLALLYPLPSTEDFFINTRILDPVMQAAEVKSSKYRIGY